MLSLNPELQAYNAEIAKRRNASRSPRFPSAGSYGRISSQRRKGMDALMGWAINSIPTEVKDNQRLM